MGMFDTVHFTCPQCNESVSDQSKGGPCILADYSNSEVPMDVAGYIIGDKVWCQGCKACYLVSNEPYEVPKTVELFLVPYVEPEEED